MPTKTKSEASQIELLDEQITALDAEIGELQDAIEALNLEDEATRRNITIEAPPNSLFDQIATTVERTRLESSEAEAHQQRSQLRSATQELLRQKQSDRATLVRQKDALLIDSRAEAERATLLELCDRYRAIAAEIAQVGQAIVDAPRDNLRLKYPQHQFRVDGTPLRLKLEGTGEWLEFRHEPLTPIY